MNKRAFFTKSIWQAALIVVLGAVVALLFNALRTSPLPLLTAPLTAPEQLISITEAAALHQQGKVVFIDARDAWSFEEMGHLPGALNVEPKAVASRAAELVALANSGKKLIAYCDGEGCSLGTYTARHIAALGVPGVRVLHNGWTLWQQAGLPLAKGKESK
jgi:rhodanese-related sulfurtransferase